MSDASLTMESPWGPWEAATKSQRAAQPYKLQKANRGDGLWSQWARDARQSQPDQWSDSSAKWKSICRRRSFMEAGIRMGRPNMDRPDQVDLEGF